MKALLRSLLLTLAVTAAAGSKVPAQPPEGSQLPPDENACAMCHGETDMWVSDPPQETDRPHLFLDPEALAGDIHWQKGVNCHDCHGGDPFAFDAGDLHLAEDGFRELADVKQACGTCHKDPWLDLIKGVHAKAGEKDQRGRGTPMACIECHGGNQHLIVPVDDPRSPVRRENQVQTCGACHEEDLQTYLSSVHGHLLSESEETAPAVCASCHGSHGIYYKADDRSKLYPTNVAATCGVCHEGIEEKLRESIHGGDGAGELAKRTAPSGTGSRKPSCTDCHQRHDLPHPKSDPFRLQVRNRCGNCHAEQSERYAMSVHGELTELGYGPAAKCSDCHGAHRIWGASDSRSRLSAKNRVETCKRCHRYALAASNFVYFDPHADYRDPARDPLLYWVSKILMTLLILVFGFFGLHSMFWFVRSTAHVMRHGRPAGLVPGATAYQRFGPFHRLLHTGILVALMGLVLTGLPLRYSHYDWARTMVHLLGLGSTDPWHWAGIWHRVCGVIIIASLLAYLARMLYRYVTGRRTGASRKSLVFGPNSPVPNARDLHDFGKMNRWFVGLGPKPTFERWSYWEKFDFWAVCAGIVVIGSTGLILWFPNLFCVILPGNVVNIAKVIHSTQALLGTGLVFAIYLFNTHLRAEKFPTDLAVLTGLVSDEELREERRDFYERLRESGRLDELRSTVPSPRILWLYRLGGFLALGIGLSLLVGMILAGLG